jgi:hypothetical protein
MTEAVAIELTSPAGEPLRVEWPGGPRTGGEPDWRLSGELDWDEIGALRIISAALPDGRGLALAALRAAGPVAHGDELVAATLVANATAEDVDEALISTEYDGDGLPRRVGLELYTGADSLPLRVAADVTEVSRDREAGLTHIRAALEVRLEGKRSTGRYEALSR